MMQQNQLELNFEQQTNCLAAWINQEIALALGGKRDGVLQKILQPLLWKATHRFARIATRFENDVADLGSMAGAANALPGFAMQAVASGQQNIPTQGPLIVVSNHPGGLDSLALVSQIPHKKLAVMVSDIPFFHAMQRVQKHYIYVNFKTMGGMEALRLAIRHLQDGGALLIFAHGEVEPDPETMSGAQETITEWSKSLEVMLRKVPATQLVIATIGNVLLPAYIHHPITRLRKLPARRQKLAEFLQVIRQMLFPGKLRVEAHITFSKPIHFRSIEKIMPSIIGRAQEQMQAHLNFFKQKSN